MEHRVNYYKVISNKREWNNCFIKYQTLADKNISNLFPTDSSFRPFRGKFFRDKVQGQFPFLDKLQDIGFIP